MLILFGLLASGLLKVQWVRPSANLFIRYMVLMFIPISVGLMVHVDLLVKNIWPILASAIGGTTIVLVVLSYTIDRILKKGDR